MHNLPPEIEARLHELIRGENDDYWAPGFEFKSPYVRRKVPKPKAYPYSAIGRIYFKADDGNDYYETGAILASNVVLAPASSVWNRETGEMYEKWAFQPRYPVSTELFPAAGPDLVFVSGEWKAKRSADSTERKRGFTNLFESTAHDAAFYEDKQRDIAFVCILGNLLKDSERLYLGADTKAVEGPYRQIGYPTFSNSGEMWECIGEEYKSDARMRRMRSAGEQGPMGCVWLVESEEGQARRRVVGITIGIGLDLGMVSYSVSPRFSESVVSLYVRAAGFTTTWETSLPNGGKGSVSVLAAGNDTLYAGANGRVYRLNSTDGKVEAQYVLPGREENEVRLATGQEALYLGVAGWLYSVKPRDLKENWKKKLPDSGSGVVSVLRVGENALFAGSSNQVYRLNLGDGEVEAQNVLLQGELHEVRLAYGSSPSAMLFAGTQGFVYGLSPSNLNSRWTRSLVGCEHTMIDVLFWNNALYAGSDGIVHKLDPKTGNNSAYRVVAGKVGKEIRMATDGQRLYVGAGPFGLALSLDDLTVLWQTQLPKAGGEVTVHCEGGRVFFGSAGFAYHVNASTGALLGQNTMNSQRDEVRFASVRPSGGRVLGTYARRDDEPAIQRSDPGSAHPTLPPALVLPSPNRLPLFVATAGGVYGLSVDTEVA